jgi:hypothetical protein
MFTPLWFFTDYLFFDKKGATRLIDPFTYTIFPIYYFVYTNIRAVTGEQYQYGSFISQFPYPFLDYAVFGIYGVSAVFLVLILAVILLGFLFVGLDKIMEKPLARYKSHIYGAISKKPSIKLKFRFLKSKTSTTQDLDESLQDDPINTLDFLDADHYENK